MLSLTDLFKLQSTFNERVGLDSSAFQALFREGEIIKNGSKEYNAALVNAGRWVDDILKAMSNEIEELRNCTYWKHWSQEAQRGERYRIKDVEAARKEVIDILHFWISLAQILGMSPEMVSGMYAAKLAKNIKRQDDGYSIEVKDKAYRLWCQHPEANPMGFSGCAESLEDMPEEVAAYYLEWAKNSLTYQKKDECKFPSLQGCGCKLCGQEDCSIRRYKSILKNRDES